MILEEIQKIVSKDKIFTNEPMSKHTSFKIGGPAEIFVKINNVEELKLIIKISKQAEVPITVVGNGSNLLVSDDGKVQVGNPYVKGVKVEGKVVAHGKAKKIIVFKMKAKKNERTKQGHRQPYTKVEITGIKTAAKKTAAKAEKTEKVEA